MTPRNQFSTAVKMSVSAARQAVTQVTTMAGGQTDPDLARYETLTPPDFDAISEKYGFQGMMDYIQAMEARRLRRMSEHD